MIIYVIFVILFFCSFLAGMFAERWHYLKKKEKLIDLLYQRSDELSEVYGDLGGACSGAAQLLEDEL